MIGMVVDDKILVGSERVQAGFRFPQSLRSARHPVFQSPGDGFNVPSQVYLPADVLRVRQISKAVKGCLDSIAKIRKAIKRRGKTLAVDQECWKIRSIVGMDARRKPCLDVA